MAGKRNRKHPLTPSLPLCHPSFYRRYCGVSPRSQAGMCSLFHSSGLSGSWWPRSTWLTGPYRYSLAFLFLSLHWTCVSQPHYTSARHSLCKLSDLPDTWHSRSVLGIHFGFLLYQVRHTRNPAGQDHGPSFTFYHYQHRVTSYLYSHDKWGQLIKAQPPL